MRMNIFLFPCQNSPIFFLFVLKTGNLENISIRALFAIKFSSGILLKSIPKASIISINGGNISNAYYVKDENNGFDYGGLLCFNINKVRLYAAGTRFGLYGGIGLAF